MQAENAQSESGQSENMQAENAQSESGQSENMQMMQGDSQQSTPGMSNQQNTVSGGSGAQRREMRQIMLRI